MPSTPLKWHGGNDPLKKWLWGLFPASVNQHRRWGYTHRAVPFFGGGQEQWELDPEGISETFNDLNPLVANFFNALASPQAENVVRRLSLTPFSETVFNKASRRLDNICLGLYYGDHVDEQAAVDFFIVNRMSRQGLGRDFATPTTRTRRGMNEQVSAFLSAVDGLPAAVERMRRVEFRNQHFRAFVPAYDHRRCFFLCDPPYLHFDSDGRRVRQATDAYACEMTYHEHEELLETLARLKGKFLLQGYPSKLYRQYARRFGWREFKKRVACHSSSKAAKDLRTECVWTNYDPPAVTSRRTRRV